MSSASSPHNSYIQTPVPASNKRVLVTPLVPSRPNPENEKIKANLEKPCFEIPVIMENPATGCRKLGYGLIDSGCSASAIDKKFAQSLGLKLQDLPQPMYLINTDGSPNALGMVTKTVDLTLSIGQHHRETVTLLVGQFHLPHLYLGDDWLCKHNPDIDWDHFCPGKK